ncbi:MAG: FmdB family zinc ribbon protein [Alkalispirochaetaceae bacterium]
MPTYDYQCDSCGHVFEAFQSMSDDPLRECPECKEAALRRLISGGSGVIFKGSGFYVTDSRKSTAASGSGSKSSEQKSESKGSSESKAASDSKTGSSTDAA